MSIRSSIPLVAAKVAAVTFALGTLTWFVVAEQRRANPIVPAAPPGNASLAAEAPPEPAPADPAVFLSSSKTLVLDSSPSFEEASFLLGSKSGVLAPISIEPAEAGASAAPPPVFLPNSKSRLMNTGLLRPALTPGAPAAPAKSEPQRL